MTDRLRELAQKIDRATPGPWVDHPKIKEGYGARCIGVGGYLQTIARVSNQTASIPEGEWSPRKQAQGDAKLTKATAEAICLARNEAPALLREAADEIERLRGIAKVMATAIWYRHDTPEATMTANEFLNDPATKEAQ